MAAPLQNWSDFFKFYFKNTFFKEFVKCYYLFSLGVVVVLVALSLAFYIYIVIGENERGRCVSVVSTVIALISFNLQAYGWSNPEVF